MLKTEDFQSDTNVTNEIYGEEVQLIYWTERKKQFKCVHVVIPFQDLMWHSMNFIYIYLKYNN